jgi:osmotically inducible protein OsmC
MAALERSASVIWNGPLTSGEGVFTATDSGVLDGDPMTLPRRLGSPEGQTSPEELLAAAHAGCFAMALAGQLTQAGLPPGRLDVRCRVTLDDAGDGTFRFTNAWLDVAAEVDGLARDALKAAAAAANEGCPYSALIRDAGGSVEVTIAP